MDTVGDELILNALARALTVMERLRGQVCDGDLPYAMREHAQELYDTANQARKDLQSMLVRPVTLSTWL